MNKNVLYVIITVIALIIVTMLSTHNDKDAQTSGQPEPTAAPEQATGEAPAASENMDTLPMENASPEALPPAIPQEGASENTTDMDDVPPGAEVSGQGGATPTPNPAEGTALPPSEGE